MSLILEYGGGGSPPTTDILYTGTPSPDPSNNPCCLPSPPTQSISSLSSSDDCEGLGVLSSSSQVSSVLLNNNSSSSGYTSPFVSDDLSLSNQLPCGGSSSSASSTSHWHHVRHDRGDLFLPPFPANPAVEEERAFLLDSSPMEAGGDVDLMALSSSSSSSSLVTGNQHRLACKASRRRRRSPPSVTNFDINDNSLHSVYAFIKSFLSASTASTVAIDNKIEQAMDLVKSHLMFAVREEVDVLKERIGELMERINHLEYENTVLRKYAPQEALQQIQQPHGGAPNP